LISAFFLEDDIAFGGAHDDKIYGGKGQDIILGDFGEYSQYNEIWPYHHVVSFVDFSAHAGQDYIEGGPDDDYLIGSEHEDMIFGNSGSDDIIGGHNHNGFGSDGGDILYGNEGDDVILGDNGEIFREVDSIRSEFPWMTYNWRSHSAPFHSEKMRKVRLRQYNIDSMQGSDVIYGGPGNVSGFVFGFLISHCECLYKSCYILQQDVIHGQGR